jgi:hypothetical protein
VTNVNSSFTETQGATGLSIFVSPMRLKQQFMTVELTHLIERGDELFIYMHALGTGIQPLRIQIIVALYWV